MVCLLAPWRTGDWFLSVVVIVWPPAAANFIYIDLAMWLGERLVLVWIL